MKRACITVVFLIAGSVLFWCFPLFHVVPVESAQVNDRQASFDAAAFARSFWKTRLLVSLDEAANARELVAAIRENPSGARDKFGRSAGIGRKYHYFLRGSGTVVAVDRKGIGVALVSDGKEPDIVLRTGPLFGNTVRDATGLLAASDFPNFQSFNRISTELNQIVAAEVVAPLVGKVVVGDTIRFVGCAEIRDESRDLKPLTLISVEATLE